MNIRAHSALAKSTGVTAIAAALVLMPAVANAGAPVTTKTTTVTAKIDKNCKLFVVDLLFGNVPWFGPNVTATSRVEVTCTPDTDFAVTIDNGQNFNGTTRRMRVQGGGIPQYFNYEIYSNAAMTRRWGQSPAQTVTGRSPANGAKVTLNYYGRASSPLAVGRYLDTISVTLTF